ncbi:MAG: hypothetical protein FJ137_05310 [Deltaproteobacteria bacterium]|nr:hypothetical protein [Deltaproteobacteria bacterium]
MALTRTLTATKTKTKTATKPAKKAVTLRDKKAVTPAKGDKIGATKIARAARPLHSETAGKTAARVEVALRSVKAPVAPKRPSAAKTARIEKPARADKAAARAADKPARAEKPVRARRATAMVASEIAEAMLGELGVAGEDSALERQAARSQRERDLLARLAISVGRTDEMPNLELAADIVFADDADAVSVLIAVIERHDDVHAPDAARVVAEVGTRAPELLLGHAERLIEMIDATRREMLQFTMLALSPVASKHAEALWPSRDLFWHALADLTQPAELAQAGAVRLLAALCAAGPDYARTLAGGLVDLLGKCMPRDVAFFAESVLPALGAAHSHRAKPVLDRRLKELTPAEVARLRRAQRAAQLGPPLAA